MKITKTKWNGIDAVHLETLVYSAIIVPSIGANLVSLINKELKVDFLRTPQRDEIDTFISRPQIFGLPLLFPPNRIEDGLYRFENQEYQFPITIPAQNNYHHGIIKSQSFVVTRAETGDSSVLLEASFFSNKVNNEIYVDFPHDFVCRMQFELSNEGLVHTVVFENRGANSMPLGVGYHTPIRIPFSADSAKSDYKLRMSVGKRWELSDRGLPTGNLNELSSEEALLRTTGINPVGFPVEWALTAEPLMLEGKPFNGAILEDTRKGISLFYEVDDQFKHWTLWNNGGEVDWVCPEPQTWAINAPNLNMPNEITGFQALAPGGVWSAVSKLYVR